MKFIFFGLSISSSWGNGHAITYRGLIAELARRGHEVLFLERNCEWYAANRDLRRPRYCRLSFYDSLRDLAAYAGEIAEADCIVLGSYVPDGIALGEWLTRIARGTTAFYDIDTPVTLAKLAQRTCEYLSAELIPKFDLYLSFTGGPTLQLVEDHYGARRACGFYCSADPSLYRPERRQLRWDLGYLGTYSDDRQPALQRLLLNAAAEFPAQRFVVAGPQYPSEIQWPANVERIEHLPPAEHRRFYNAQRFTLNITRQDMVRAGWSPSIRLFEAAACGTTIITDPWDGLEEFFVPGSEILVADSSARALEILRELPEAERLRIGQRARERVLAAHTVSHRAVQLEGLIREELRSAPAADQLEPIDQTQCAIRM